MTLKHFLQIWILIIFSGGALAQTNQVWLPGSTPDNTVVARNNLFAVGALAPGRIDTTGSVVPLQIGAMRVRPQDSLIYAWNGKTSGKKWYVVGAVASVTSVNGQTGVVTLTIPTNTNQLANGSGYITSAGAPVQSVNGQTGVVVIDGSVTYIGGDSHIGVSGNGTSTTPYLISFPKANFDTLKGRYVDTSTGMRNAYVLSYDSVNRKWYMAPPGTGGGSAVSSFNTRTGAVVLLPGDIITALGFTPENAANKGASNGYAGLDVSMLVPLGNLPAPISGDASSSQLVKGNDTRLTNSRAPTGSAGGRLASTYPNPTLAASGVTAGSYTNANITVTADGTVSAASNGSGGGGTPAGANKQVQINNSGSFGVVGNLTADATTHTLNSDSITTLRLQSAIASSYLLDSLVGFGHSIMFGVGASSASTKYFTVVAGYLNTNQANYSVSGTSWQVDMLAKIPLIPVYDRNKYRAIVFDYLINDIINSGNVGTWDTTHLGPIARKTIDTALARGWPASLIVIVSNGYVNSDAFPNATLSRQTQYFAMAQDVATTRGVKFVDVWHPELAFGAAIFMQDINLHPNDGGHSLYANAIYKAIGDSVRRQGQQVGINGLTELQSVKLKITDTADGLTVLLGLGADRQLKIFRRGDVLLNSNLLAQAQAAGLNLYGKARIGNSSNTGTENLSVAGGTNTGFLTISEGLAGTIPNSKAALSIALGGLFIESYDRNTGTPLPLRLGGSLADNIIIGNNTDAGYSGIQLGRDTKTYGNFIVTGQSEFDGAVNFNHTSENFEPKGTTAQRVGTISASFRFNLDSLRFEGYDGTNWKCLPWTWDVSGGAANITVTRNAVDVTIASSTGSSGTLVPADATHAGALDTARAKFIDSLRLGGGLKLLNRGIGINTAYAIGDTINLKTMLGANSIAITADPDSTNRVQLVNDTSSTAPGYSYGFSVAGRRGFYPNGSAAHLVGTTTTPSIAAGTGAGTSPTVSIAGNDMAGTISITAGTAPTAGQVIVTVTFTTTLSSTARVILQPANQAVGSATVFPTISVTGSTTQFYINTNTITGLIGSTVYAWNYIVVQ